ncbi:MAG: trimeric intracellular cation channel family protein [Spirochaetales bacterium]|nr:trimeric intracellular cation channel family protein [Spirochaetales bacterium]
MATWFTILDLAGTAVFAFTGALKAFRHKLDILGVLVLSALTGVGGGMLRDALIGELPPAALRHESYIFICLGVALAAFLAAPLIARWRRGLPLVMVADAVGLGVFTAIGAAKGDAAGLGTVGILLTASLSAVGGGILRDVLVREIPAVIQKDFYATASLLGAGAYLGIGFLGLPPLAQMVGALLVCTGLRLTAMATGMSLPKARLPEDITL